MRGPLWTACRAKARQAAAGRRSEAAVAAAAERIALSHLAAEFFPEQACNGHHDHLAHAVLHLCRGWPRGARHRFYLSKNGRRTAQGIDQTRSANQHLAWISTGTFCLSAWKLHASRMHRTAQRDQACMACCRGSDGLHSREVMGARLQGVLRTIDGVK